MALLRAPARPVPSAVPRATLDARCQQRGWATTAEFHGAKWACTSQRVVAVGAALVLCSKCSRSGCKKSRAKRIRLQSVAEEPLLGAPMQDLRKKLNFLEMMRAKLSKYSFDKIKIPGIVVVGEQSAGKSSLLESMSGIKFPRAQKTCTRMPCVLTLLTDPDAETPRAFVSMDASFKDAASMNLEDVERKISDLTSEHTSKEEFISKKPIYIRVVRKEGPQLSLIDLPGVTHNSDCMDNIHDVTEGLVVDYIEQEELVVLCVVPASSDFANAEVIKLAKKYDPDGTRTLGVVTKCDDAARANAGDFIQKMKDPGVTMPRGFYCVVNRSQSEDEIALHEKEGQVFGEQLRGLDRERCGIQCLVKEVAAIQEKQLQKSLPKIQEAVDAELKEIKRRLDALPPAYTDPYAAFHETMRKVEDDLRRLTEGKFIGSDDEIELALSPRVAEMTITFRDELLDATPKWLDLERRAEVSKIFKGWLSGHCVDNLTGSEAFVALVKRTFVEDGLLVKASDDLVDKVGQVVTEVVSYIVKKHVDRAFPKLAKWMQGEANTAISQQRDGARELCCQLAEAQQVASTVHPSYKERQQKLYQKEYHDTKDDDGALEVCSSLEAFSQIVVEGFSENASKIVRFRCLVQLVPTLDQVWRQAQVDDLLVQSPGLEKHREELLESREELKGVWEELRQW